MKTFLHYLLWIVGLVAFNGSLPFLLNISDQWMPLYTQWCLLSGVVVGFIAMETAP